MAFNRHELPSPYYRVAVRGIVYDEQQRVLVVENDDHLIELPGGGWEYEESFDDTMRREFREELAVDLAEIGEPWFLYRGFGSVGVWMLRVVARVRLVDGAQPTPSDNMISARYVSRDDFLQLNWCGEDRSVLEHLDKIWPPKQGEA